MKRPSVEGITQAQLEPRGSLVVKADPDAGDTEEDPEAEEGEDLEGEEEEDEDTGEPEDTEDEDMSEKSQITAQDFEKSLDRLAGMAGEGGTDRKAELLEKAQTDDLDDAERMELYGLLGGQTGGEGQTLAKSTTEGLEENETLRKAYDVSDFLSEQHMELTKSLTVLADRVEADSERQHGFNLVLAKAVVDTGNLVKSMAERMNIIAAQPARAPKSQGAQPLNKSFVGGSQPADGEQLNKAQILGALDEMMQKSMETGGQGMSPKGLDINMEVAKYESQNAIHPVMLQEVQAHIASKRGNGR